MAFDLSDDDFLPQEACRFQHWGERDGEPFSDIRPLTDSAAEPVWAGVAHFAARAVSTPGVPVARLDLNVLEEWDPGTVTAWLLSRFADVDERVLVSYQPRVAVSVPWGAVCRHWLVFFWTGARVCDLRRKWLLVHDGDRFDFSQTAPTQPGVRPSLIG